MIGIGDSTSVPRVSACVGLLLIQHWPLIGAQYVELAMVDRLPVVLKDDAGISRVWIPRPVGVVNVVRFQEGHQGALPHTLGILAHRAPSKLPDEHWGSPILLQIGPMLLPDGREGVNEVCRVADLEPLLPGDLRPVVMG